MRLEQESYEDAGLASFIEENFIPLEVHIKENPRNFRRFNAFWTPTVLILDADGIERTRLEGYLPKDEFNAHLTMGLARVAMTKKRWADAEQLFESVIDGQPDSPFVPQAIYYRGVSRYSVSHESSDLALTAVELDKKFRGNEWQLRSIPWLKD